MNEVFSNFSERASNEVDGGLANVKFNDIGFFSKRDDLFKFGRTKARIQSQNGPVERVDHVVNLGPLVQVTCLEFIHIGRGSQSTNAG